jgi:hypothetical protein
LFCSYQAAVIKGESERVGKAIIELFQQQTPSSSDQEILEQIKAIVEEAQSNIKKANNYVEEYGAGLGDNTTGATDHGGEDKP